MSRGTDSSIEQTREREASRADVADTELDPLPASDLGEQATVVAAASGAGDSVTAETEGRYVLGRELGSGGQSRVVVAYDTHLGREIAFKQPRGAMGTASGGTSEALNRFLREARITARLEHPNIVPVYEIGRRADGSYYCAQKLIRSDGAQGRPRTLGRALAEARSFEERLELLPHFLDVCHGIAYAHEHDVIHRDIKPDNIVIGRLGETVVLDWGIAKVLSEASEEIASGPAPAASSSSSGGETEYGYAFGTPSYMSPEQASGHLDRIDQRSDVWSLGAVLYELLTGRPPHVGETAVEIVQRVIDEEVEPVRTLAPDAPPALAAVAEKALARAPQQRYASAADLAAEVAAFLSGLRVGVYRYSLLELVRLFVNRHRAVTAVTAIAAILLAASSAVAWRSYRQAEGYLQEAQGYLADARENLAGAFVEKARRAERELQWDRAAAYYAAARAQADLPEARWGAILTENRKNLGLERLEGHQGPAETLAFSPDSTLLATAGSDQTVRLWEMETLRERARFDTDAVIYTIDFAPDGAALVTGSGDGGVRLLSVESGEQAVLFRHPDEINTLAFSPRGDRVVVGTADYHVIVYDLAEQEILFDREVSHNPIYAVAYAPDGGAIFAGGWDGTVYVFDSASGEPLQTIEEAHNDAVLALALSPDGKLLVTGGRDDIVNVWNVSDATLVHRLAGHQQKVYAVTFSPDGALIASGSTDKTVRLWSATTGEPLVGESYGLEHHVSGVKFSPDGERLAWVGDETVWLRRFEEPPDSRSATRIESVDVSPDGSLLASVIGGSLIFSDPASLDEIDRIPTAEHQVHSRFSPDGKLFAGNTRHRGQSRNLAIWDVAERELLHAFPRPSAVRSVAFAPDGSLLAVGLQDGKIELWDTAAWRVVRELEAGPEDVLSLAFSPGGGTLASGSYDTTVYLWNTATWTERARLVGHSHGVRRIAFSHDGSVLATASWDRTIRLWNPANGEQAAVLKGHEDYVFGLAFDPKGHFLVSVGWDGTLRVWGLEERRELAVFVTDEAQVYAVTMLPGGDSLVYAGHGLHRIELGELASPEEELERVLRETGLVLRGIELERAAGTSR